MIPATQPALCYRCPGEAYEIPLGVHLARLASGYPQCRECAHRDGAPAVSSTAGGDCAAPLSKSGSLLAGEGIRGIHLNELTRGGAGRFAAAFASLLWEDSEPASGAEAPARPESSDATGDAPASKITVEGITLLPPGRPGPTVVLARDERPAAPDLLAGVGAALRRMGCRVIDVGLAARPGFWFAVDHLEAAGGIHVTGASCGPAWIGLDFVRRGVIPCSRDELDRIETRSRNGHARPSRRAGSQQLCSVLTDYESGFSDCFHALRPLKIALGCASRIQRELLERLFRKAACRLIPVQIPTRARDLDDSRDPDVIAIVRAVRGESAHLGILIDDDAQRCVLIDDEGNRADPARVLSLLAEQERETHPQGLVVGEDQRAGRSGLAAMSRAMREPGVVCGGGLSGRYWFAGRYPQCDAALTLVRLAHVLSRSDTPFSELLSRVAVRC